MQLLQYIGPWIITQALLVWKIKKMEKCVLGPHKHQSAKDNDDICLFLF